MALAVAWIAYDHGGRSYCCDATTYIEQGLAFSRSGVLGASYHLMDLRAYGYGFFVALASLITDHQPASIQLVVFVAQLTLLLFCARIASSITAGLLKVGPASVMAAIALNPVLLVATSSVLSDLLSALCATMAVFLVFDRRHNQTLVAFTSMFLAAYAAVVRPASVVFVPMVLVFWLARGRYVRRVRLPAWCAVVCGGVLPFIPQILNNRRLYGVSSPLIVHHLYSEQLIWGMRYLKYGTLLPAAGLYYVNPWYDPQSASFAQWFVSHPLHCLATMGIHLFALFDQDFAFAYIHNLHPWFRWPLTTANLFYLFVSLVTLARFVRRMVRHQRIGRVGFFALTVITSCAGYLVVYVPTAVESRFSLPVYVLLSPYFVWGTRDLWRILQRRDWRLASRWALITVIFLAAGLWGSHWLSLQAPALR